MSYSPGSSFTRNESVGLAEDRARASWSPDETWTNPSGATDSAAGTDVDETAGAFVGTGPTSAGGVEGPRAHDGSGE